MIAPTINSYSRMVPGSWAPTDASWGFENRTCESCLYLNGCVIYHAMYMAKQFGAVDNARFKSCNEWEEKS